jgi:hypothetical protein
MIIKYTKGERKRGTEEKYCTKLGCRGVKLLSVLETKLSTAAATENLTYSKSTS